MRSLIIAFAMYSRVPVPHVTWDDKGMKYAMCYFPLVGAGLTALSSLAFWLLNHLMLSPLLISAVMASLPVLYTGGIHFDGFLDTEDALHSYKSREERLAILKDSHIGAFAVISGITYMILSVGFCSGLTAQNAVCACCGYIFSRILSAIAVVAFPKAGSRSGSLRHFADAAGGRVLRILIAELLIFIGVILLIFRMRGAVLLITGAFVFLYYYRMSRRIFGGITGDVAGYFVTLSELWMLIAIVMAEAAVL